MCECGMRIVERKSVGKGKYILILLGLSFTYLTPYEIKHPTLAHLPLHHTDGLTLSTQILMQSVMLFDLIIKENGREVALQPMRSAVSVSVWIPKGYAKEAYG